MKLIKELGVNPVTKRSHFIFECPKCLKHYELSRKDRGLKQESCKECRDNCQTTHGMSGTKIYSIWQMMIQRCENPKNKKFHIYGGKGITVDDKWKTFKGFFSEMGDTYRDGLSIDRKDSGLGYNVSNCRWIPLGRNSSETSKRRPVVQMTKRFKPVKTWESAKYAADELGLTAAHITAVCRGDRQTHGKFRWEYAA